MLERRASTISLSVISDSSSSRGSIAPSLRSPGFGGSGGRPSGPARRPSMVGAQPPAPLPPVITSTPSVDHSYSAPIVMTLSGTTGSTASAISSNSTLMNTIPSSPAVSSLLKHAGSSGARAVSTPSFLRRSASGYIGRRSGASTPSSSAAGSPLRNVIELVGEVDEHRPPPVPLPISAGGVSKSISEPQLGSGSLFIGTSISDSVLAVSPRTPLRPGGTRSRRVSLRGTIRTPDTATSAAYESSSSFADAEESNSPSDSEHHLFPRFETVDTDELPPRSPLSPIGPPSGRRTGSNSRSRPPNNRRRSRSGTVNRRSVTKQDSTTSIRTVVAMSSPGGRAQPKLFEDEQAAEAEAAEAGDEAAYDSSNFASSSRARDIRVHKERSRELEKLDRTNESGKGKQRRLTNSPETSMLAASDFGSEEGTPRLDTIDPATVLLSVPERDEPGQDLIPEPGSSLGLALGPVAHTDSHSRAPLGRRAGPVTPQLQIQPDNAVPVIISPGGVVDTPKPMEVDDSSGDSLNEYANVALTDSVRAIVRSDEERFRELAWEAVREELEYYAEKGDIQMCAHLATVAPGELSLNSMRQEQFVRAYVELLERNRMHAQAAYVRKYCTIEAVRSRALVHTAVNLACGRCRKPIDIALDSTSSMSTKRELRSQALCTNCQLGGARCSICRLPIEGLVIQCPVCTHGGHQDCVRRYYGSQPMRSLHAHEVPARPWHERLGLSGSGISSGPSSVRHATMPPAAARPPAHGMSLLTANAPSRAASLLSTISSAVPSPAMTSSASATVSSCADGSSGPVGTGAATATATHTVTTTEKNSSVDGGQNGAAARRTPTMMGHPCAAGCGHYCWVASMGQGQSDAAGGFLGLQVAGVAAH
ncbi:hypothetical protein BKA62DRAFT_113271 [Auriculariales sp. MPI-PUGE-AT-0066]|nr:hypothetical protein BKA62DRAFT_113271 [Auriculariales sp. MPI-PUGE-AT-0066]